MDTREFIDLKKVKLGGKFDRRKITLVGLALLALMILGSSVYQVGAESVGVVLRLGKYHRTQSPGLNIKLPLLDKCLHRGSPTPAQAGIRLPDTAQRG